MSYTRNFGMRSFENIVRAARFRAPASGTPIKIGAPVVIDDANPGRVKEAAEADAPGANAGLAVYEHIQFKGDALSTVYDAPYDSVPLGQYVQIVRGPGVKVWFKNTLDKTLIDGRVTTGYVPIEGAANAGGGANWTGMPAVGDGLVPAGGGKWRVTDGTATAEVGGTAWMIVEQSNPTTGLVEARLTF